MPPRDSRLRLEDIHDAIEAMLGFTRGMTFETFSADRRTVDAVIKNIAVMGEAANGIPEEFRSAHPEIPWNVMRDIRNVVIHEYFGTSLAILWETVTQELPDLAQKIRDLLQTE